MPTKHHQPPDETMKYALRTGAEALEEKGRRETAEILRDMANGLTDLCGLTRATESTIRPASEAVIDVGETLMTIFEGRGYDMASRSDRKLMAQSINDAFAKHGANPAVDAELLARTKAVLVECFNSWPDRSKLGTLPSRVNDLLHRIEASLS